MDNDTLNSSNTQTNTPLANAPSPEPTPQAEPVSPTPTPSPSTPASPESSIPATNPAPVSPELSMPETNSAPLVDFPASVTNTTNTSPASDNTAPATENTSPAQPVPINDVEQAPPADPIPLVDASSTVSSTPNPASSAITSSTSPTISDPSNEPTIKRSPILNSAPIKVQKFDLKYLIPIIILGVLVLGLGIYLIVDKVVLEPKALEAARKAAAASAVPTITNDVSVDTGDSSSNEPLIMTYSNSNSLNGTGTYLLTSIDNAEGVTVTSNDASTVAEFSVDWTKAKAAYSDLKTSTGTNTYTIDFGQGLTEIFYGTIGTTGYYLFLLDDGTVDYLDIHQALLNKSFTASGPIDGVENVIKFLDATTSNKSATILAQQATGEYYDLSTFLK